MTDENEDYVTKPKLKITVKPFSKYIDRVRIAAKQTNLKNLFYILNYNKITIGKIIN